MRNADVSGRMPVKITILARQNVGEALTAFEVSAERFGKYWAVNANPFRKPGEAQAWNITHVPSGLAAAQMLDRVTAVRLAQVFVSMLDVEQWDHARHTPIAEQEVLKIQGFA
jgi:hypothetical protein